MASEKPSAKWVPGPIVKSDNVLWIFWLNAVLQTQVLEGNKGQKSGRIHVHKRP